jgi:voltage-gated potassium channel
VRVGAAIVVRRVWLRSKIGKLLLVCLVAMLAAWLVFYACEVGAPDSEYSTPGKALRGIVILLISGFDVDPPETTGGYVAAFAALVFGLLFVASLTAEIAAVWVEDRLLHRKGEGRVRVKDHVLLCGSSQQTEMVARQLTSEQHVRPREVVIVSEREPEQVEGLPRIHYVRGDPADDETLARANLSEAFAAIVLADDIADAQAADSKTILTALAIEALNPKVHTCVELRDKRNRKHLRHAGVDEVVCLSEVAAKVVAQSALNPRLATLLGELLSFESGDEFYKALVPPEFVGISFEEALARCYREHRAVLVAIERDREYVNWSDEEITLREGDIAVIIAAQFPEGLTPA